MKSKLYLSKLFLLVSFIFMTSSLHSHNHSSGGIFEDFFLSFKNDYIHGCVYNEFGKKIKCVTIEYDGGAEYDNAVDRCLTALRPYLNEYTNVGGCV